MSDPVPAPVESAPAEAAAPQNPVVSDPVASLPEATPDQGGDYSFEQALEQSLSGGESTNETTTESSPSTEDTSAIDETESGGAELSSSDSGSENVSSTEESQDLLESLSDDVGDDWTPKASAAFEKLKSSNKALNSERETLTQRAREAEAKVAELEGVVGSETLEKLQQKVQEYENTQMISNLESTAAYKEAVLNPLEKIFMGVEKLAEDHNVNYQDLVDAIAIEDPTTQEEKVAELLVTATDRERATFYRLASEIDPILQRRDELQNNASEALQEAQLVEEQRSKQEAADRAAKRVNVTRNVAQRIKDKVPFLSSFDDLDLESIQTDAASVDPTVVHPVDFAYQAVAARLMPNMVKEYAMAQKQIEQLTTQLASYEDAEPKLSSGTNPPSAGKTSSADDFGSAIERALGG